MSNDAAAIDNDPLSVVFTLNARFGIARFFHLVAHTGGQCFGLTVGSTRGDDDPLKEGGHLFCIEHHNFLCFHIFQGIDNDALEFLGVFFGRGFVHRAGW